MADGQVRACRHRDGEKRTEQEGEVQIYEDEATELCSIHMLTVLCENYSCLQPSGSYKSKHDILMSSIVLFYD